MRAGRKRKSGTRTACGDIKRPSLEERAQAQQLADNVEKLVVLAQPHRRGDISQLTESPLGRLVLRGGLRRELYDSGIEYGGMVRRFYAAAGIPQPVRDGHPTTGAGVDPKAAVELRKALDSLERSMRGVSLDGYRAVRTLAVHEREIVATEWAAASAVLYEIAVYMRKLGRRDHPYR